MGDKRGVRERLREYLSGAQMHQVGKGLSLLFYIQMFTKRFGPV